MKHSPFNTILSGLILLIGGTTGALAQMNMPAPTVLAGKVSEVREEGNYKYIGKIVSVQDVSLKARVAGYITESKAKEGEIVQAGQELIRLEDTTYQAKLKSAEAKLDQVKAEMKYAESNYERQKGLADSYIASKSSFEDAERLFVFTKARLAEAEANVIDAKNELSYTRILAPATGRIGKLTYSPGNYVDISSQSLGDIVQIAPIRVKFAISEADYLKLFGTAEKMKNEAVVRVTTADGVLQPEIGTVYLVNNRIDPNTSTIMIWAVFPNEKQILIPGGLVTVSLSKKSNKNLPAVPLSAVMTGKDGNFVYVLDDKNNATVRPIVLGEVTGNIQTVRSGLKSGETVVIDGTHKIFPGKPVNPKFVESETKENTVK